MGDMTGHALHGNPGRATRLGDNRWSVHVSLFEIPIILAVEDLANCAFLCLCHSTIELHLVRGRECGGRYRGPCPYLWRCR